ncbi:hypothetical protein ABW19_dt0208004 [Dactylella cylindrospora]|nr:hypothetical protein ABW19_dt0208004 [Dactylella cylindrospora]
MSSITRIPKGWTGPNALELLQSEFTQGATHEVVLASIIQHIETKRGCTTAQPILYHQNPEICLIRGTRSPGFYKFFLLFGKECTLFEIISGLEEGDDFQEEIVSSLDRMGLDGVVTVTVKTGLEQREEDLKKRREKLERLEAEKKAEKERELERLYEEGKLKRPIIYEPRWSDVPVYTLSWEDYLTTLDIPLPSDWPHPLSATWENTAGFLSQKKWPTPLSHTPTTILTNLASHLECSTIHPVLHRPSDNALILRGRDLLQPQYFRFFLWLQPGGELIELIMLPEVQLWGESETEVLLPKEGLGADLDFDYEHTREWMERFSKFEMAGFESKVLGKAYDYVGNIGIDDA